MVWGLKFTGRGSAFAGDDRVFDVAPVHAPKAFIRVHQIPAARTNSARRSATRIAQELSQAVGCMVRAGEHPVPRVVEFSTHEPV